MALDLPPIRLPPTLLPAYHLDLLLLSQLLKRNRAQHKSALFYHRAQEVERLGVRVLRGVGEILDTGEEANDGDERSDRSHRAEELRRYALALIQKILPVTIKATEHANKMIHHLHFLPLVTVLLAIFSRLWLLSLDLVAHLTPSPVSGTSNEAIAANAEPGEKALRDSNAPHPASTHKRSITPHQVILSASRDPETYARLRRARAELDLRALRLAGKGRKGKEREVIKSAEDEERTPVENNGQVGEEEVGTRIEREITPPPADVQGQAKINDTQSIRAKTARTYGRTTVPTDETPASLQPSPEIQDTRPSDLASPVSPRQSSPPSPVPASPATFSPPRSLDPSDGKTKKKRMSKRGESELDDLFDMLERGSGPADRAKEADGGSAGSIKKRRIGAGSGFVGPAVIAQRDAGTERSATIGSNPQNAESIPPVRGEMTLAVGPPLSRVIAEGRGVSISETPKKRSRDADVKSGAGSNVLPGKKRRKKRDKDKSLDMDDIFGF